LRIRPGRAGTRRRSVEKGRRRARYRLVATNDDELYAWGDTRRDGEGNLVYMCKFHSYRSVKMVNVQVVCVNYPCTNLNMLITVG
jgi:hypothetical protein